MQKVNIDRSSRKTNCDSFLNEYLSKLKKIEDSYCQAIDRTSAADFRESSNGFYTLQNNYLKMGKIIQKMSFFFKDTLQNRSNEETFGCFNMEMSLLHPDSRVVVFRMNVLLPHKIVVDASTNKCKYVYDRAALAQSYRKFMDFNILPTKTYDSVFVLFENIIPKSWDSIIDADNLDVKVFIDTCVNKIFVPDDSMPHVNYCMVGRIEDVDEPHTVAYVGPKDEIICLL